MADSVCPGASSFGLQRVGGRIEYDGASAEVRLVGHVTGNGRVVAEDDVLHDRLARLHGLEVLPEMRARVVVRVAHVVDAVVQRFFAWLRIVLGVP